MLYPFLFEPILKSCIWGGNKLSQYKALPQRLFGVGESWEISQVEGNVSVLANGPLQGYTLTQLIKQYPQEVLGKKVLERYGARFPLLFKFIDAKRDLSVQVHPNDEMARRQHGAQAMGKTEMWYVIEAEPYAALIAGFSRNLSTVEYHLRMQQNKIEEVLHRFKVQAGDAFFIPPGLVHSIGGGIMLLEIQQSSDLTYRMYDYNRVDSNGRPRELHTQLAAEALDYSYHKDVKIPYTFNEQGAATLVDCEHFHTRALQLVPGKSHVFTSDEKDSFVVYNCLQGQVQLHCESALAEQANILLPRGSSVLVPAALSGRLQMDAQEASVVVESHL